ncbi:Sec11-like 3, isoform CRA_b, partial [Conidiobolus coronatus NRRL 28638]
MASSYMSWRALGWACDSESPAVVVMSDSMAPAFHKGDILFQHLNPSPIEIGEVVVFKLPDRPIPIVHRVLKLHADAKTGEEFILTKGDDNPVNDRGLYDRGQLWLERKHIIGRIKGHLPYVGMIPLLLNENPKLKQVLLFILAAYAYF